MLSLEALCTAARIYERVIDADRMAGVDPARGLARLKQAAAEAQAERAVVVGIIGALLRAEPAVRAAVQSRADAEGPAAAVPPLPANDHTHGLSAPSETPPNIA